MRIEWTPPRQKPQSGSTPSKTGLIATLRRIGVGHEVLVKGWTTKKTNGHLLAARRGSARWYESKTITAGVLIRRCE